MDLVKKQKLKNLNLEVIVAAASNPESNMNKENIFSFFEEMETDIQGKKAKQNFFSFTLDQLKNNLKL